MLSRLLGRAEARGAAENPLVPLSSPRALADLLGEVDGTIPGVEVTVRSALSVPAVWAAVRFLSGTIASLPLNLYRRTENGRERVTGTPLATMVHDAVSDDVSSFRWRQLMMTTVLTHGRAFWRIARNADGAPVALWKLDRAKVTVRETAGMQRVYRYQTPAGLQEYAPRDVIDIDMLPLEDGVGHYGPIKTLERTISLAIALEKYGAELFANGGVPPLALSGPFTSPQGVYRAAEEVLAAVRRAGREGRKMLVMPMGHELKPIGLDPEKGQMTEAKRFIVEEIARIYGLPPVFLQDLTHGTFTNTEQQDLQLVKHTLGQWLMLIEQEINLKFFGRGSREFFVEFNLDGLLRGDFASRMAGYATAISHGVMKPNEARGMENRPDAPGGDDLLIQGATVKLATQGAQGDED